MSTTIEQKVVEMKFDNSNFEKNVQTSMSTLDKLKEALNKATSANAFEELGRAANKLDFGGLASQVQTVADKFSVWEEIAIGALRNIGASIEQHISQNLKKLTIDNVVSGWERFAQKTESVQTILSAIAGDTDNDYGEDQLSYVEELLEKLAWYSDETSYGFTDMTDNISKFVAAGLNLDVSTDAMMGIANWAAMSGQNASVAARAMYQLSQAMGMGSIRLMDWKSIEVANMATKEVKEMLLEYAALSKDSIVQMDQYGYYINDVTAKGTKRIDVDYKNFRETLKYGWLTADAFSAAMADYSSYSNALYEILNSESNEGKVRTATELIEKLDDAMEIAKETGRTLDDIMLNEYHVDLMVDDGNGGLRNALDGVTELGIRAMKAAQQARTWKQVIDSITDAASTQWSFIFENIFGNVEEATALFTELSEFFYDVFVEPLWSIRDTITAWKELGGRVLLFGGEETSALHNLEEAWFALSNAISKGFRSIFPATTAEQIYNATERFRDWTATLILGQDKAEKVSHAVSVVADTFKRIASIFGSAFRSVKTVLGQLQNVMGQVFNNEFFEGPITGIRLFFIQLTSAVKSFFDNFKLSDSVLGKFRSILEAIKVILNTLGGAFGTFSGKLAKLLKIDGDKSGIQKFAELLGGPVLDIFLFIPSKIADFIVWIDKLFKSSETLKNIGSGISSAIKSIKEFITGFIDAMLPAGSISDKFNSIGSAIGSFIDNIKDSSVFKKAKEGIQGFFKDMSEFFANNATYEKGVEIFDKVKNALSSFGDVAQSVGEKIADFASAVWDGLKKAASAIKSFFGKSGSSDVTRGMPGLAYAKELDRRDAVGGGPSADMSGRPSSIDDFAEDLGLRLDDATSAMSIALEEFKKAETLGDRISNILNKIKDIWGKVTSFIENSKIGSWVVDKIREIKDLFAGTSSAAEEVNGEIGHTLTFTEKLAAAFQILKNAFKEILEYLSQILPGIGLGAVGIGGGAVGIGLGGALLGFGSFLRRIGKAAKWIGDGISEFGTAAKWSAVKGAIKEIGNLLVGLGEMVLMFAVAAVIFSKIDSIEKFDEALHSVNIFLLEILGAVTLMVTSVNGGLKNAASLLGIGTIFTSIGIAVLLIVAAMSKVMTYLGSEDSATKFSKASEAITNLLVDIMGMMLIMLEVSKGGSSLTGVGTTVLMVGITLLLLASAINKIIKTLNGVDPNLFEAAMQTMLSLMLEIMAVMAVLLIVSSSESKLTGVGAAIVMMGISILLIASAVSNLAKINTPELDNAATIITTIMELLIVIMGLSSVSDNAVSAGAGFVLMALAVGIIVESILTIIPAVTEIAKDGNTLKAGLIVLASVIAVIATMTVAMAVLGKASSGILKAAAALTLLSVAVGVVTAIIIELSKIVHQPGGVDELAIALLAFAGILGTLVLAAYLVAPAAAPFAIFGAGVLALGLGLLSFAAAADTFVSTLERMTSSSTLTSEKITVAIRNICDGVANAGPEIVNLLSTIIVSMLTAIGEARVQFITTLLELIDTLLDALLDYLPSISAKLTMILDAVWDNIKDRLSNFFDGLWDIFMTIRQNIHEWAMQFQDDAHEWFMGIVGKLHEWLLELINNVHEDNMTLIGNIDETLHTIIDNLDQLWDDILTNIQEGIKDFIQGGVDIIDAICQGILDTRDSVLNAIDELILGGIKRIGTFTDQFLQAIVDLINSLADSVERFASEIWIAVRRLAKAIVDLFLSAFTSGDSAISQLGKFFIDGFIKGAQDAWNATGGKIWDLGKKALDALKGAINSSSPSKETAKIGGYFSEGFAKGIEDSAKEAVESAEDIGESAIDALSLAIANASSILSDDDFVPTITPVMDLSEIQNGMTTMGGMLSQYDDSYALNAALAARYSPFVDANGEAILSPDERISARIDNLQQKFDDMIYKLGKIQVVLDSGAVVGELVDPMDEALGRKSVYVGRGMLTYG